MTKFMIPIADNKETQYQVFLIMAMYGTDKQKEEARQYFRDNLCYTVQTKGEST